MGEEQKVQDLSPQPLEFEARALLLLHHWLTTWRRKVRGSNPGNARIFFSDGLQTRREAASLDPTGVDDEQRRRRPHHRRRSQI